MPSPNGYAVPLHEYRYPRTYKAGVTLNGGALGQAAEVQRLLDHIQAEEVQSMTQSPVLAAHPFGDSFRVALQKTAMTHHKDVMYSNSSHQLC